MQYECQNCGSDKCYDRSYQRCTECGEPFHEGALGLHWMTKQPPPPKFFDELRSSGANKAVVLEIFDEPDADGNVGLAECPACGETNPFPDDTQDPLACVSCDNWFQVEPDADDPLIRTAVTRFLEAGLSDTEKKVVDAFVNQQAAEGRFLSTDGRSLYRNGMGSEKVAVWRGDKIAIVSTESVKSDEVILRYLVRAAGKGKVTWAYDRPGFEKSLTFQTGGDFQGDAATGQYDGWISAFVPGRDKTVGTLEYTQWAKEYGKYNYQIKMVEVDPEFKRSGVATELYRKLFKEHKITKNDLVPAYQTDEGHAFRERAVFAARYKSKKKVKTQKGKEFTVYQYSDRQIANRNNAKAKKVEKLGKSIGKLRAKVKRDIKSSDPEKMLVALAVALMDHTYERVGNDTSAGEKGHFGVTGWQRKHVSWKGGASVNYVGKSGVKHSKKITDAGIRKALRNAYEAAETADSNLFGWEGGSVTAAKVNEYLAPFKITAKDIRGYHANQLMRDNLTAVRKGKLDEDKKKRDKQLKTEFLKALDDTAEAVGHEAATLRSQYLVPGMEEQFLKDGTVPASFVKTAMLACIVERYKGL
jgi:GNAT superfamily N-acetyltransferase